MISLTVKPRKELGKKVKSLRDKGILPGVLYGPKTKAQNLEINQKEFDKIYKQAGESSLISLDLDKKKFIVLIHQVQLDPITSAPVHVDFLLPSLTEEISAKVPLVFEGEAPAVKELGGTLVKSISEVEVKALPEKLPHEIKVDVTSIKTFEESILIKNLVLPEGVKIMKGQDDIIAFVASPQKIEEELEKPIEEKVEEVEKVEKAKKEEETEEETTEAAKKPAK
jgi:large subunit ribosomal protein L25